MKQFLSYFLFVLVVMQSASASAQISDKLTSKNLIVKSNILNLLAKRPTISIEKFINKNKGLEISVVQGVFQNFLLTDYYGYTGFLLRYKKYSNNTGERKVNPYTGLYVGNLIRNIESDGFSDRSGFFSVGSRSFLSNSIRIGGSLGVMVIQKGRFVVDTQASLGYGRYIKIDKADPDTNFGGYIDTQFWISIGYAF